MFGSNETLSIVIKARDEASRVFSDVERNAVSLHRRLESAAGASRTFALGLAAGTAAIGGLGYAALKAANDMEQTRVAFETMLGSAGKADTFVRQLVDFARTTPFELSGLQTAAKQLLAYGFAQEEVIPNLRALGDIASGVGMDKLPNLILAFGQVRAATRLTGMELRQFTEAGVPLLQTLSEQLGKPVAVIQEMVSAGQIGFTDVEQALKRLTAEGGRFNGLMEKQSHTLGGMMSNLADSWNLFLAGEGQKLLEWAKHFIDLGIYIIQNVLPAWINGISKLVDWLDKHKVVLYIVAGAIVGALVPAIYAAAVAFAALAISLAPFIIGGALIGALIAGIVWVAKNWETIWGGIRDFFVGIWQPIKDAFSATIGFIIEKIEAALALYDRLKSIVQKPIKFVANALTGGAAAGAEAAVNTFRAGSGILGFEKGGIVPGPIGAPVPAIVHGGERVLPASVAHRESPSPVINFHFHDVVAGDDGVQRIIRQTITQFNRESTLSVFAGT
jgi:tape measure domain-containing protein